MALRVNDDVEPDRLKSLLLATNARVILQKFISDYIPLKYPGEDINQMTGMIVKYFNDMRMYKEEKIISFLGLPVSGYEKDEGIQALCNNTKRPLIDRLIAEYNAEIAEAGNNKEEKLLAIVRFIRKISITHPFADCNQRLFVFLILNKLLLENNFLPTIVEQPLMFDGYLSASELVIEVKKGFDNFLQAVHGIDSTALLSKKADQLQSAENATLTGSPEQKPKV